MDHSYDQPATESSLIFLERNPCFVSQKFMKQTHIAPVNAK